MDERSRQVAGTSLLGVGVLSTLGIVTAGVLYPDYSTAAQTISALGASTGPAGTVRPAATVFNGAMIASGLLTVLAAAALRDLIDGRALPALVAVTGLGVLGVGLFPAQTGAPHTVAALVAFAGGGAGALATATVVVGPFRYLSAGLGTVALLALVLFVSVGGATPLGVGGLERWITYPTQLWATAAGGYLLGDGDLR